MKKLSVSLIAVVAVLFAVASAFTTRGSKMADPYAEGWHQVLGNAPYFPISNPLALEQDSYESVVYTTDQGTMEGVCPEESDKPVCAAFFTGSSEIPQNFLYRED